MNLPSLVLGLHPTVSLGFGVEPAQGDGPATLIVSFLLFHIRIPLPRSQK